MKGRPASANRPVAISARGLHLRIFLPFALGYFLSYLYRTVNAVIAPNLANDIGVDPSGLGLLTAAYFIAFASSQLPLGILLDRFGPRRIEAGLLLFAAAGAYIFARSETLTGLAIGRALIGFGVSACLMAAFKAFVMWFPAPQLPLINGIQMTSGGLGALSATAPVEFLLGIIGWRSVFLILAVVTLAVALIVFLAVPDKKSRQPPDSLSQQLTGIKEVFGSPVFWRIAPWATLSQAGYLAIQGLWSGPWLRDAAGYDRSQVAQVLLLVAIAMTVGYLSLGMLANRLSRAGWSPPDGGRGGHVDFHGNSGPHRQRVGAGGTLDLDPLRLFRDQRYNLLCGLVPTLSGAPGRQGEHRPQPDGVHRGLYGPVGYRGGDRSMAKHHHRICRTRLPGRFRAHIGVAVVGRGMVSDGELAPAPLQPR